MKYVLGKLFLSINWLSFCCFLIYLTENNLYWEFFCTIWKQKYTQLCSVFHLHCVFEGRRKREKKRKNLFNVCRLCSRYFFLLSSALFIGKHSFIIYHRGAGRWKIILCRQAAGRKILANLISDKSVISRSTVVVVRLLHPASESSPDKHLHTCTRTQQPSGDSFE